MKDAGFPKARTLTFVGAGSVRSPLFLQAAFRRGFQGEIRFFDKDPGRLELMQRIGLLLMEKEGMTPGRITVTRAKNLEQALAGTDAVVTAIRPGGLMQRARDEQTAFSLGLLGQETVGVCGIAMALRTLPDLLQIAGEAERLGGHPWIFNFTNPVGITSLGLWRAGFKRVVGICDSANQALYAACQFLDLDPDSIQPEVFGLNHLSWTRALWHRGENLLDNLLKNDRFLHRYQDLFLDSVSREQGLFFNEYLYYYFWPSRAFERMSEKQPLRGAWLAEEEGKLLEALEHCLEENRGEQAVDLFLRYHARRSESYMAYAREIKRGGPVGEAAGAEGYAGVALDILEAHGNAQERVRVLVLPDPGPLAGLPEGPALEVSCRIRKDRLLPSLSRPVPEACERLIRQVGLCEQLVAESILEGSREKLERSLEKHPLVGPQKAGACMKAFAWGSPSFSKHIM